MSVVEDWTSALDDFETSLDAILGSSIAGEHAAVPPFVPPTGLGPMPDVVVPRARALLVRSREVEMTLTQARDAVRAKLSAPPATRPVRRSRLDISV